MYKKIINAVVAVSFLSTANYLVAAQSPWDECVGRYTLRLPEDYDVALTDPAAWDSAQDDAIQFSNGELAPSAEFTLNGTWKITPMNVDKSTQRKERLIALLKKNNANNSSDQIHYNLDSRGMLLWGNSTGIRFEGNLNGLEVRYSDAFYDNRVKNPDATSRYILANIAARNVGEIPHSLGICLPGLFIKGRVPNERRVIGVAFRLKEHPNITVNFIDGKNVYGDNLTTQQLAEHFWNDSGLGKKVRLEGVEQFQSVSLDQRNGLQSIGEITRNDGTVDYGYLAVVAGKDKSTVDTPNLIVFVVSNSKHSINSGPVNVEEIKKIGKEVVDSVHKISKQE